MMRALLKASSSRTAAPRFNWHSRFPLPKSIDALEAALQSRSTTCVAITEQALAAIRAGRSLRAVLEVNPDALAIARRLDARQTMGLPPLPLVANPQAAPPKESPEKSVSRPGMLDRIKDAWKR